MRVLMINIQIGSGSVGTIVSDLYKGIITNGDECKIAYSRGGKKNIPEKDTIKIGNKIDSYIHAVKSRMFGSTATYSKRETRDFLKEADRFKPDIIHIHGLYGYYINMEMLFEYIREHNIALVTTLHSCWDFTGHCCYFDYVECEQWKDACKRCPQKKSYPKSSFLENTKKNLKEKSMLYHSLGRVVLVSPSKWMDGLVSESCLKDLRHTIINNGINTERFRPSINMEYIDSLGIKKEWPTILSVASLWDMRKGYGDIIELAHVLEDEEVNIVVIGLSEEQLRNKPNKIIGIRRTDNLDQLITLYSFATIFFNPTYEDNYPTVNLEAIACGTPVITYDTGGSPEIIYDLNAGIVIDKKDFGEIIHYIKSEHLFSFRSDERVRRMLDSGKMVDKYIRLYKNLSCCK